MKYIYFLLIILIIMINYIYKLLILFYKLNIDF